MFVWRNWIIDFLSYVDGMIGTSSTHYQMANWTVKSLNGIRRLLFVVRSHRYLLEFRVTSFYQQQHAAPRHLVLKNVPGILLLAGNQFAAPIVRGTVLFRHSVLIKSKRVRSTKADVGRIISTAARRLSWGAASIFRSYRTSIQVDAKQICKLDYATSVEGSCRKYTPPSRLLFMSSFSCWAKIINTNGLGSPGSPSFWS